MRTVHEEEMGTTKLRELSRGTCSIKASSTVPGWIIIWCWDDDYVAAKTSTYVVPVSAIEGAVAYDNELTLYLAGIGKVGLHGITYEKLLDVLSKAQAQAR